MNPLLLGAAAAAIITLGSLGYGQWQRADRIAAEARLEASERLLKANQAALSRLEAERNTTVAALEQVAASVRTSAETLREARTAINAAPRTTSCVALPGVRALRNSLRARPPGGAVRSPPAAQ